MLRFTKAQQELILNQRRLHISQHAQLAQQHGLNGQVLVGNASPLPRDVWGEWDRESVEVQRNVLAVFNDLAASVSMPMNIGKMVHYFRQVTDSGEAVVNLDGRQQAKADAQEYAYHGTPLPIINTTFGYGWREMSAAQTEGESLDDDGRQNAFRTVAQKLEDIAISGDSSIVVAGDQLYGLTNHPKRATRSTGVTLNGATGAQWVAEFKAALQAIHAKNFREPITFYVNWDDWFYAGTTDYSTSYQGPTIAQKILQMDGVREVVPASGITASDFVGVAKRRQVVQVLNGMPMTSRALFRNNPEDDYNFMVLAAAAVEIKYDSDDNCGIVHSS